MATANILEEILVIRNRFHAGSGANAFRFIELMGAKLVNIEMNEPDPKSYRSNYYYNSSVNRLYTKITTTDGVVWKAISI